MRVTTAAGRAVRALALGAVAGLALARRRRRPAPARDDDLPDDVLVARVRAEAAVPDGVEVVVTDGAVVLFGRVPRYEVAPLLQRVARVPGVSVIEDRLTGVDGTTVGKAE